ncbi:hypothetical protein BKA81DRAFT_420068 [Phyllosticta paracitricarpa]|uniref:Uncharacterized protein n=1 Tax=Phyllosticta paracitricarpa TaxID=2016321 RepID=A0ABR1MXM9_9PEZI
MFIYTSSVLPRMERLVGDWNFYDLFLSNFLLSFALVCRTLFFLTELISFTLRAPRLFLWKDIQISLAWKSTRAWKQSLILIPIDGYDSKPNPRERTDRAVTTVIRLLHNIPNEARLHTYQHSSQHAVPVSKQHAPGNPHTSPHPRSALKCHDGSSAGPRTNRGRRGRHINHGHHDGDGGTSTTANKHLHINSNATPRQHNNDNAARRDIDGRRLPHRHSTPQTGHLGRAPGRHHRHVRLRHRRPLHHGADVVPAAAAGAAARARGRRRSAGHARRGQAAPRRRAPGRRGPARGDARLLRVGGGRGRGREGRRVGPRRRE